MPAWAPVSAMAGTPNACRAIETSVALWCSPVARSMSSSRGSGSSVMAPARASSSSVVSPIAETTTTRSQPVARSRAMRAATRLIRSALATDEPPNFCTTSGLDMARILSAEAGQPRCREAQLPRCGRVARRPLGTWPTPSCRLCDHSRARGLAPPTEDSMFRRRDRDSRDEDPAGDAPAGQTPAGEELDGDELDDLAEDTTADLDSQAAEYFANNDVWMYGPNATAVLEILDWLEEIVPSEARPLAETWLAIQKSDRDRARKAARKIAEDNLEIGRHLQLAREAVTTWMAG